jgi:hypothetical protein
MNRLTFLLATVFAFHTFAAETPVETDPRLHSDGKGWKLNQATTKDPKRPRVLLIGDSILSGYMAHAIKRLDGKAYVDAWVNPYNQSEHLNTKILPEVLAKGPYDVIHFNMGLHGWQEGRIKPGTFEPLTKRLRRCHQGEAPQRQAHLGQQHTRPARRRRQKARSRHQRHHHRPQPHGRQGHGRMQRARE